MSEYDYYIDYIEAEGLTQEEFSFEDWCQMVADREEDRQAEAFSDWLHE